MKSTLLIISFLFIRMCSIGQNLMFDSNYVWTEAHDNAFSPWTVSRKYTFSATPTTINNLTYYQILSTDSLSGEEWFPTSSFIRTQAKKVYLNRNNIEILLYNFNAEIGDLFYTHNGAEIEVIDDDTIVIANGESKRRLKLICTQIDADTVYWIDGIGSLMDFEQGLACQFDWYAMLLCSYYDGELIYMNPDVDTCWVNTTAVKEIQSKTISVFPNPFDTHITINTEESPISMIFVSDIMGRNVYTGNEDTIKTDQIRPGFYIIVVIFKDGTKASRKLIKL